MKTSFSHIDYSIDLKSSSKIPNNNAYFSILSFVCTTLMSKFCSGDSNFEENANFCINLRTKIARKNANYAKNELCTTAFTVMMLTHEFANLLLFWTFSTTCKHNMPIAFAFCWNLTSKIFHVQQKLPIFNLTPESGQTKIDSKKINAKQTRACAADKNYLCHVSMESGSWKLNIDDWYDSSFKFIGIFPEKKTLHLVLEYIVFFAIDIGEIWLVRKV